MNKREKYSNYRKYQSVQLKPLLSMLRHNIEWRNSDDALLILEEIELRLD